MLFKELLCLRGGKLFLMPVDEAHQMRPHMTHLDEPAAKPAAPVVKAEPASDELSLLTVSLSEALQKIQQANYCFQSGGILLQYSASPRHNTVWGGSTANP